MKLHSNFLKMNVLEYGGIIFLDSAISVTLDSQMRNRVIRY